MLGDDMNLSKKVLTRKTDIMKLSKLLENIKLKSPLLALI